MSAQHADKGPCRNCNGNGQYACKNCGGTGRLKATRNTSVPTARAVGGNCASTATGVASSSRMPVNWSGPTHG